MYKKRYINETGPGTQIFLKKSILKSETLTEQLNTKIRNDF
jgi:hypothetical protein